MPNGPLEVVRDVARLFRCSPGYPDPANRARLLEPRYLIIRLKKTTRIRYHVSLNHMKQSIRTGGHLKKDVIMKRVPV